RDGGTGRPGRELSAQRPFIGRQWSVHPGLRSRYRLDVAVPLCRNDRQTDDRGRRRARGPRPGGCRTAALWAEAPESVMMPGRYMAGTMTWRSMRSAVIARLRPDRPAM